PRPPPRTPFPYTPLFRSFADHFKVAQHAVGELGLPVEVLRRRVREPAVRAQVKVTRRGAGHDLHGATAGVLVVAEYTGSRHLEGLVLVDCVRVSDGERSGRDFDADRRGLAYQLELPNDPVREVRCRQALDRRL